jgi:hypothetical protein
VSNELSVIQKYAAIVKMNPDTAVPWHVWRCLGNQQKQISISGTDICLGEDYVSLEQARAAVQWYVEQLGGTVKWNKA